MDGPAVPDENAVGSAVVAAEYVYRTPCDVPKTCVVYRVPIFAVVANRFVVVTAFDTYKLPETCNVAVGTVVPIPTLLLVDKNMFEVDAATPELTRYTI